MFGRSDDASVSIWISCRGADEIFRTRSVPRGNHDAGASGPPPLRPRSHGRAHGLPGARLGARGSRSRRARRPGAREGRRRAAGPRRAVRRGGTRPGRRRERRRRRAIPAHAERAFSSPGLPERRRVLLPAVLPGDARRAPWRRSRPSREDQRPRGDEASTTRAGVISARHHRARGGSFRSPTTTAFFVVAPETTPRPEVPRRLATHLATPPPLRRDSRARTGSPTATRLGAPTGGAPPSFARSSGGGTTAARAARSSARGAARRGCSWTRKPPSPCRRGAPTPSTRGCASGATRRRWRGGNKRAETRKGAPKANLQRPNRGEPKPKPKRRRRLREATERLRAETRR